MQDITNTPGIRENGFLAEPGLKDSPDFSISFQRPAEPPGLSGVRGSHVALTPGSQALGLFTYPAISATPIHTC